MFSIGIVLGLIVFANYTQIFTIYTFLVFLLYFQFFTHYTPLCFMPTPSENCFIFFTFILFFSHLFVHMFFLKNQKYLKIMKIHKNIKNLKNEKRFLSPLVFIWPLTSFNTIFQIIQKH